MITEKTKWLDIMEVINQITPNGWKCGYCNDDSTADIQTGNKIIVSIDCTPVGNYCDIRDKNVGQIYVGPIVEPGSCESQISIDHLKSVCSKISAALTLAGFENIKEWKEFS